MFNAEYEESEQDTREALAYVNGIVAKQKRQTIIAVTIFVISCAAAFPFMYGQLLHQYWFSFGKFLPLLSIALFIYLTVRSALLYYSARDKREIQRNLTDLLTRRKA